jgi:hypothetical protein
MPMVQSSEEGCVGIGDCPGGRVRHAGADAAISETISESSSADACSNAQRAWANTSPACIPDEISITVSKRTLDTAECNAAGDTLAASEAFQGTDSEWQPTACI